MTEVVPTIDLQSKGKKIIWLENWTDDETIFLGNTINKLGVLIILFHINELGVPHKSNYVFFCNEPIWLPHRKKKFETMEAPPK
jgi:hypothetical protein